MSYFYPHDHNSLTSIESGLSSSRIRKYLAFSMDDLEKALELHAYNSFLGASLHPSIQNLELFLRNACDRELTSLYGQPDWFNAFPNLPEFSYLLKEIQSSKQRLRRLGRNPDNPPCVIADLNFGFWVGLFVTRLDRHLYRKGVDKALPHHPSTIQRSQIHSSLDRIRHLRNRIAHHEPIFHKNLEKAHDLILKTSAFISPNAANWINHHSQFLATWNNIPLLSPAAIQLLQQARNNDKYFD